MGAGPRRNCRTPRPVLASHHRGQLRKRPVPRWEMALGFFAFGASGHQTVLMCTSTSSCPYGATIQREFRSRGGKSDRGIAKSLGHGLVILGGKRTGTRWSCLQPWLLGKVADNPDPYGLLRVAEFCYSPTEVAPLHGICAKVQCSLVRGQCFVIPPEPAQKVRPRGVVWVIRIEVTGCRDLLISSKPVSYPRLIATATA